MKVYKKLDTIKNKQYNILAKEYITKNNIKCKYYGWVGMAGDFDNVLIDGNIKKFNINTQKILK